MRAELIAIGSELLLGDLIDTNSAWISQRLAELGVNVYTHITIGDNPDRLKNALRTASERADIVICTGGLGPTQDDLTREMFAEFAGVEMLVDKEVEADIADYLVRHGYPVIPNNLKQAQYPKGARMLQRIGTAPGIALTVPEVNATLFAIPGVPTEMRTMFENSVVPIILELGGGKVVTVSRVVNTVGIGESQLAYRLDSFITELDESKEATLAFLAGQGKVRIRLTTQSSSRQEALAILDPLVQRVADIIGQGVVGVDETTGVERVADMLIAQNKTIAVAESISAGMFGTECTSIAGASQWFAGGLIVYQTDQKTKLGHVDAALLEKHGPVSVPTAVTLAQNVHDLTGASIGVSVVGVAGPETQGGQPVGTIFVSLYGDIPAMPQDHKGRALLEENGFSAETDPQTGCSTWVSHSVVQNLGRTDIQKWAVTACIVQLVHALSLVDQ